METAWKYDAEDNEYKHASGATLAQWQVMGLLTGASEASFREAVAKEEGWSEKLIADFVHFVNVRGGFEYK